MFTQQSDRHLTIFEFVFGDQGWERKLTIAEHTMLTIGPNGWRDDIRARSEVNVRIRSGSRHKANAPWGFRCTLACTCVTGTKTRKHRVKQTEQNPLCNYLSHKCYQAVSMKRGTSRSLFCVEVTSM